MTEFEAAIYVTTQVKGIQKLSLEMSRVTTIWKTNEILWGVAFDVTRTILCWTYPSKIYLASAIHKTEPEILLTTTKN